MNNCKCNDYVGLCNRYLKEARNNLSYDVDVVEKILDELCIKLKSNFKAPLTIKEFLTNKKGKLGCRYVKAAQEVIRDGFNLWQDNDIRAFIKNEIYDDESKPPRMIMGRNPKFNMLYGLFTTALEKAMVCLPEVSKGRNFLERGEQFFNMMTRRMLEIDFSKYESTQRYGLLKQVELGIWKRICPEQYDLLSRIFKSKMRKKGVTLNGQKFEFWYCRGSGDMDTGLFNTLLTYVACKYFFIKNNDINGKFICDGDDNVLGLNGNYAYINTFAHFGFDAKIEERYDYHDVNYCSGKFIQYKPGKFIYVQNLTKLMKNIGLFRARKFEHCKSTYYHSLGYMYKVMYGELPVFKEISEFLLRSTKGNHVSMEMLEEINPSHADAFTKSKNGYHLDIDIDQCKVEMAMCFLGSIESVENTAIWYKQNQISLSKAECGRYNPTREPRQVLEELDYDLIMERLLAGSLIQIPKIYADRCG